MPTVECMRTAGLRLIPTIRFGILMRSWVTSTYKEPSEKQLTFSDGSLYVLIAGLHED